MYEKAGEYTKAALYWHRAMRGVSEVWIPVMWGDVSNAPGKWKEYRKFVPEYRARLEKCLRLGEVSQAQLAHIEFTNEIWLDELIEQEDGGFRASCGIRAEEAEKYGDFTLAEVLRRGQARLFRLVAAPYHEKAAQALKKLDQKGVWGIFPTSKCEKQDRHKEASLHLQAAKVYEQKAVEAEKLAKGDEMLSKIPGFGGKSPWTGIELSRVTSIAIRDAYYRRVLNAKGERQTEMTPEQVAATLRERGLSHDKEDARCATVTVLANLGEKEALVSALDDASAAVRLVAAKALLATRWAEGWTACANHRDAAVRALMAPLLKPAEEDVLSRTYVITELINGLDSASAGTRSFCQNALERITGQKLQEDAWSDWWKELGDARPGIVRTGPGAPPKMDERIDFGIWWQSGFGSTQHRPNALSEYQLPATIQWRGHLVVTQPGQYWFYARNRGQSIRSGRRVHTSGRYSFPAYFPAQLVKLEIDGRTVLPGPDADVVEDPSAWVRLDFTGPIRLEPGLHKIRLEFNIQSYDDAASASSSSIWGGTPCLRLYWSSEHFLRELVPAEHLVSLTAEEQPKEGSYIWSFEKDELGAVPEGWKAATTMAIWRVIEDKTAPSGKRALALTGHKRKSGSVRDSCWTDAVSFLDGEIEVCFKAVKGQLEKGGGVIWRVQNEKTYYSARTNYGPRGNNIGLYCMVNWDRVWKVYAENVFLSVGDWHTMKIVHHGASIKVYVNRKKLLDVTHENSPLSKPGGVGIGTKGDAVTSFDDLHVRLSNGEAGKQK